MWPRFQIVLFLYWADDCQLVGSVLSAKYGSNFHPNFDCWLYLYGPLWGCIEMSSTVSGSVLYISENIILIFQIYFRLNSKLMLYVVTPRYYGWTRQIFFQINIIELDNLLENEASGYQPVNQWNMKKKAILPSLLLILSVQCSRY